MGDWVPPPGWKPGPGRPKGSLSKSTKLRRDAREIMDLLDYNPIAELVQWARDETKPADTRIRAHAELLDRFSPKLKSVTIEHHGAQALSNVVINVLGAPQQPVGQVIDAVATTPAAIPHIETLTPVDAVTGHDWANLQKEIPPNAWDEDQDEDDADPDA